MTSSSQAQSKRARIVRRAIAVIAVIAIIVAGAWLAGVFLPGHVSPLAQPAPKSTSQSASAETLVGTITTQPKSSEAFFVKYADATPDNVGDVDRKAVDEALISKLLKEPGNLKHWQLCKAELTGEAHVTQAWVDAVKKYPADKPYTDPDNDPQRYDFLNRRAQAMRDAGTLAEQNNIACIDEPTQPGYWLEFTLALPSGMRRVVIPDRYVLLYMFESAEQIVTANPPLCADQAQSEWNRANAVEEARGHESWSQQRSKYETLAQWAAMRDLRTTLGHVHC